LAATSGSRPRFAFTRPRIGSPPWPPSAQTFAGRPRLGRALAREPGLPSGPFLRRGRVYDGLRQRPPRVDQRVPLAAARLPVRVVAVRVVAVRAVPVRAVAPRPPFGWPRRPGCRAPPPGPAPGPGASARRPAAPRAGGRASRPASTAGSRNGPCPGAGGPRAASATGGRSAAGTGSRRPPVGGRRRAAGPGPRGRAARRAPAARRSGPSDLVAPCRPSMADAGI
jgi:translation initiation factor IF-2